MTAATLDSPGSSGSVTPTANTTPFNFQNLPVAGPSSAVTDNIPTSPRGQNPISTEKRFDLQELLTHEVAKKVFTVIGLIGSALILYSPLRQFGFSVLFTSSIAHSTTTAVEDWSKEHLRIKLIAKIVLPILGFTGAVAGVSALITASLVGTLALYIHDIYENHKGKEEEQKLFNMGLFSGTAGLLATHLTGGVIPLITGKILALAFVAFSKRNSSAHVE